jgi:hypothetical protein
MMCLEDFNLYCCSDFLRHVIAKNQIGSKEQQGFVRDALTRYARSRTKDYAWDHDDPERFYEETLREYKSTHSEATQSPPLGNQATRVYNGAAMQGNAGGASQFNRKGNQPGYEQQHFPGQGGQGQLKKVTPTQSFQTKSSKPNDFKTNHFQNKGKGGINTNQFSMAMDLDEEDLRRRTERERRFQQDKDTLLQQRMEAEESANRNKAHYEAQHREALEQTASMVGVYDELHWANNYPLIVGTCQVLEKPYFRLTTAPDPRDVRPFSVLQRAFNMLKMKWVQEPNYSYMCEQLKSIRQDLQVQRLFNAFAVEVYECHARIALEMVFYFYPKWVYFYRWRC